MSGKYFSGTDSASRDTVFFLAYKPGRRFIPMADYDLVVIRSYEYVTAT